MTRVRSTHLRFMPLVRLELILGPSLSCALAEEMPTCKPIKSEMAIGDSLNRLPSTISISNQIFKVKAMEREISILSLLIQIPMARPFTRPWGGTVDLMPSYGQDNYYREDPNSDSNWLSHQFDDIVHAVTANIAFFYIILCLLE